MSMITKQFSFPKCGNAVLFEAGSFQSVAGMGQLRPVEPLSAIFSPLNSEFKDLNISKLVQKCISDFTKTFSGV